MDSKIRYRLLFIAVIAAVVLAISACGSKNNTPAAPQTPAQNPAPQTPQTPAAPAEEDEWTKLVAAAEKEGKVVVSGPPGDLWRKAIVEPFSKAFPNIQIELTGMNGRDYIPRLVQERSVNQYLWDVYVGGPNSPYPEAGKSFAPVKPHIILDEIKRDDIWLGGSYEAIYADRQKEHLPSFLAYSSAPVSVNRDFISEAELSNPEQLLDPKFKGKIVLNDPREGAGLGYLTTLHAGYGEQYIRDLLAQGLVVTGDSRQLVEWVIRGTYPIAIGLDSTYLVAYLEQNVGTNIKDITEGPMGMSIGFGSVGLIDRAPNPNAAKLFINWLLTAEAQAEMTQILKLNSRRLDVPRGDERTAINPQNIDQFISHQEEEYIDLRNKTSQLARELIK